MAGEINILEELGSLVSEFAKYGNGCASILSGEVVGDAAKIRMAKLQVTLLRRVGYLGPIVSELSGIGKIDVAGRELDIWRVALKAPFDGHAEDAIFLCVQATNMAIGKLAHEIRMGWRDKTGEKRKITGKRDDVSKQTTEERPKAFIAHGGQSPSLDKLKECLIALGIEPLIVEDQPSRGRSIGENVDWCARQADFAVILATKGDKDAKTGSSIPRGNVLIEIGKAQELFPDRIIYLLQAGTKFPSNISEKVRIRFVPRSMDDAFIKIVKELRDFGILKTFKPQKEQS